MKILYQFYICQAKIFLRDRISVLLTMILPLVMGLTTTYSIAPSQQQKQEIQPVSEEAPEPQRSTAQMTIDVETVSGDSGFDEYFKIIKADEALSNAVDIRLVSKENGVSRFNAGISNVFIRKLEREDGRGPSRLVISSRLGDPVVQSITELVAKLLIAELNIFSSGVDAAYEVSVRHVAELNVESIDEDQASPTEPDVTPSQVGFYFPNFLALAMLWLGLFSTAIPLASDRAEGSFTQLTCAPISMSSFMLSYVLWRLTVGVLQSLLFLAAGWYLLEIAFVQHWALFAAIIVVGNLLLTLFGISMVVVSGSVQVANAATQIANLVLMFTSGLLVSLETVPALVRYLSYLNPMTYIGDAMRQTMSGYPGLFSLQTDFIVLAGLAVFFCLYIYRYWRWS